ncbi:MAG: Ig-like domain-containing protein [Spirochaetia bacterium]|nr:Ig-like domain-containing protein [Spirochaetia bacterium]
MKAPIKIINYCIISIIAAIFMLNCTSEIDTNRVTELSLSPDGKSVLIGKTLSLSAVEIYKDGKTSDVTGSASWSTSDSTIATISAGVITGVKSGKVTVTASYEGFSDEVFVFVSHLPEGSEATPVSLDSTSALPYAGTTDFNASYYTITGLNDGSTYLLVAYVPNHEEEMVLTAPENSTDYICAQASIGLSDSDFYCLLKNVTASVNITVDGSSSPIGAAYTFELYEIPEGNSTAPREIAYSSDRPYFYGASNGNTSGTGGSYYKITGLNQDSAYTISVLKGIATSSNNVSFSFFYAAGYDFYSPTYDLNCEIINSDICTTQALPSTDLYIQAGIASGEAVYQIYIE